MLRVGDRVFPIMNMGHTGIIVEVRTEKTNQWMVGGSASGVRKLVVEHDDGATIVYTSNDLMRLDD